MGTKTRKKNREVHKVSHNCYIVKSNITKFRSQKKKNSEYLDPYRFLFVETKYMFVTRGKVYTEIFTHTCYNTEVHLCNKFCSMAV